MALEEPHRTAVRAVSAPMHIDTRRIAPSLLAAAAGAAAFTACLPDNQSGHLNATRTGDLGNALAERGPPAAEVNDLCPGSVAPGRTVGASIRRRPYLQQVTDRGALVAWASDAPGPARVSFRQPGSAADQAPSLREVEAVADVTALALKGSRQWMAAAVGLRPDTVTCYEIREGAALVAAAGFRTAPAADSAGPVRLVAFGDSGGGGSDQDAVRAQLRTVPFDFIVHTGDLAYPTGTRSSLQARFFEPYADLLDKLPVFPASGNHEYQADGGAPFREAFLLPENGGEEGLERWYSFDWGPVHLVALDTERTGPAQARWLEADLAANVRPWVIVYGHRPPFASGAHGGDPEFQRHFVPVLERFRVPLVLSGHEHHYERSTPRAGVSYVVTGGGGKGTRPVSGGPATAFATDVLHFVYITVAGDTLALHAIDASGAEFDGLVIRR
jgi:hypothetical protein